MKDTYSLCHTNNDMFDFWVAATFYLYLDKESVKSNNGLKGLTDIHPGAHTFFKNLQTELYKCDLHI